MRRLVIWTVVFFVALALPTGGIEQVQAVPLGLVSGNWDITNKSDAAADDFHIEARVPNAERIRFGTTGFFDDGIFRTRVPSATFQGEPGFNLELNWENAANPIAVGQTIHIGFEFKADKNGANITDAFWTSGGKKNQGTQPQIPGFEAEGFGNESLVYTLFNDTITELTIQDLQFQINHLRTDLQSMIPFTLPGFGSPQPAFTLHAGAAMSFNPGTIFPGEFLLVQFTAFPTADPNNVTSLMQQHEVPVPETSTVFLFATGFLSLFIIVWRREKREAYAFKQNKRGYLQ